MQTITELALTRAKYGLFTQQEVACWVNGTSERQYSLMKRAIAAGEVLHLRRGLYCLADRFLRQKLNPFTIAQRIYGPSYISLESALSFHGWIPEAVYGVTSVSLERSREFDTPLGHFSFTRVPQVTLFVEVQRLDAEGGGHFFMASPAKALADYVYAHACAWTSLHPLVESLRIEEEALEAITADTLDQLQANYPSRRVQRFLAGMRKEIGR
jgi:hypothetical protein